MRRCLLILPLLLLTAPAVAHAGGFATTGLSSTPDGLRAGEPWKVELTILQHGRTPLSDLSPEVVTVDADGNRTTFQREADRASPGATPRPSASRRPGQWSYMVYDGFNNAMPNTYPAVLIRDSRRRRPRCAGPTRSARPGSRSPSAGCCWSARLALWLVHRRRHPPARLA